MPNNELTPSEERLFRTLARKKALEEISGEELRLFETFQQRRLEAIGSDRVQESTRDSAASADAYDRVIEALKSYVEVVKSENSAWSTAEGKA